MQPKIGDIHADVVVANALARRHALRQQEIADIAERTMRPTYTVERDTWASMEAALLAQLVADAGSIRRAAKVLDLSRSTLSRWVREHRDRGTWPESPQ